jgi:hypothetical protein
MLIFFVKFGILGLIFAIKSKFDRMRDAHFGVLIVVIEI